MRPANDELIAALSERLAADYGFRAAGGSAVRGKCPNCGKNELWYPLGKPFFIACNRLNNCGYRDKTRDLYPDLFEDAWREAVPTDGDPHATATAYLNARGIDTGKIKGRYEQGYYQRGQMKPMATVRFYLDKGRTRYWERFIFSDDIKKLGRKNHIAGAKKNDGSLYRGDWWLAAPRLDRDKPLWLVEGIMDALALQQAGHQAAALLSATNKPSRSLIPAGAMVIVALDNDVAGNKGAKALSQHLQGLAVYRAIPPGEKDWGELSERGQISTEIIREALLLGGQVASKSGSEAAVYAHLQTRKSYQVLEWRDRYYSAAVSTEKLMKSFNVDGDENYDLSVIYSGDPIATIADKSLLSIIAGATKAKRISSCALDFLYRLYDPKLEEASYKFQVRHGNGAKTETLELSGAQVSGAAELNKALLNASSGGDFIGEKAQVDYLRNEVWFHKPPKTVRPVDSCGWDRATGAWMLGNAALFGSRVVEPNAMGIFDFGNKVENLSWGGGFRLEVGANIATGWVADFMAAFGVGGVVTLAWWIGACYAQQIRDMVNFYPFLEVVGQASSGKTSMIQFLWKLLGRLNYEGLNPTTSTMTAVMRNFAAHSNLPVVLLETSVPSEQQGRSRHAFNWNHFLPCYNGRPPREFATRNMKNTTAETPFLGSLLAEHNNPIDGEEQVLSRFVQVPFSSSHHSPQGRLAAERLRALPLASCNSLLSLLARSEDAFLDKLNSEWQLQAVNMGERIGEKVRMSRLIDNHALLHALYLAACDLLPPLREVASEVRDYLDKQAVARQMACLHEHPEVGLFWDLYRDLNEGIDESGSWLQRLNHSKDPTKIAINLTHFCAMVAKPGVSPPDVKQLVKLLPSSNTHKYLGQKSVNSAVSFGKRVHCWIFEAGE